MCIYTPSLSDILIKCHIWNSFTLYYDWTPYLHISAHMETHQDQIPKADNDIVIIDHTVSHGMCSRTVKQQSDLGN